MAPNEDFRVSTNGVELHGIAAGPPDGPLVILLHGFPEARHAWRYQIAPLAASGLRVVVPDQRGYNLSSKPGGTRHYIVDALASDVLGLSDALGVQRFAIVGHDWGAIVAWYLAGQHPDRVERAAVLNGPHLATAWGHMVTRPSQALKSWYIGFFQVPWLPELMLRARDFAWLSRTMVRSARPGTFTPEDLALYRAVWAQPGALTAMLNWYRALPAYARSFPRETIRVPVRVIWGDRDPFLDAGLAESSMALCSQGEVFHVADATHWLQHEEPERVNRLLIEFLGSRS
jgi:pimeloyl-ACP methyl ester carboxylesterase